jgi:hypothetical protein
MKEYDLDTLKETLRNSHEVAVAARELHIG